MEKIKLHKIKFLPVTTSVYKCPIVNIEFIGVCPNTTCPANIANRRSNASGCFFEKGNSNIVDVARWNKLNTHETKRRYKKGLRKLEKFVTFYNFLQNYREFNVKPSCPNCGISNNHNLVCLNTKKCDKRLQLYKKYIVRFPFNVQPLNLAKSEFWATVLSPKLESILSEQLIRRAKSATPEGK